MMTVDPSPAEFLAGHSGRKASALAASPYSDRACSAEETFRRIEPCLLAHGVTRLARLTGLDRLGIPVWQAISPNARSIVVHNGKGITDLDAKVSAAMEALERATASTPALETVNTSRERLMADGRRTDTLPQLIAGGQADIADDEDIAWAEGHDLISGEAVWIPVEAVALDRTIRIARFWQSSDGLASGNTFAEAILHGVLERIERDAVVLWDISTLKQRMDACIDPASFHDPVLNELTARIDSAGLTLRLFDITSDIGIPAVTALLGPSDIAAARRVRYLDVTVGSGAHPSPLRAVIRAVTEAAQSRLTFISGGRDDIEPETFTRELPDSIRSCFDAAPKPASRLDAPLPKGAEALLELTIDHMRHAGIASAIALPLAHTSLPFSVAKIVIPELENPPGNRKRRYGHRALSKSLHLL